MLVGELNESVGSEMVPICTLLESCQGIASNCPVDEVENNSTDEEPCDDNAECTIALSSVTIARPFPSDVRSCAFSADKDQVPVSIQSIQSTIDPFVLSHEDFEEILTPFRDQLLSGVV